MGSYFVDVDGVWGPVDLVYYGCYEEFIGVVMLRGWALYVVVDQVYNVKAICEYVCVHLGGLYGFDRDEYRVEFCSKYVMVSR